MLLSASASGRLQVLAQSLDFVQHEVDVLLGDGRRRDDRTEEIRTTIVRLVANHQRARLHHFALDDGADLRTERDRFNTIVEYNSNDIT